MLSVSSYVLQHSYWESASAENFKFRRGFSNILRYLDWSLRSLPWKKAKYKFFTLLFPQYEITKEQPSKWHMFTSSVWRQGEFNFFLCCCICGPEYTIFLYLREGLSWTRVISCVVRCWDTAWGSLSVQCSMCSVAEPSSTTKIVQPCLMLLQKKIRTLLVTRLHFHVICNHHILETSPAVILFWRLFPPLFPPLHHTQCNFLEKIKAVTSCHSRVWCPRKLQDSSNSGCFWTAVQNLSEYR